MGDFAPGRVSCSPNRCTTGQSTSDLPVGPVIQSVWERYTSRRMCKMHPPSPLSIPYKRAFASSIFLDACYATHLPRPHSALSSTAPSAARRRLVPRNKFLFPQNFQQTSLAETLSSAERRLSRLGAVLLLSTSVTTSISTRATTPHLTPVRRTSQ